MDQGWMEKGRMIYLSRINRRIRRMTVRQDDGVRCGCNKSIVRMMPRLVPNDDTLFDRHSRKQPTLHNLQRRRPTRSNTTLHNPQLHPTRRPTDAPDAPDAAILLFIPAEAGVHLVHRLVRLHLIRPRLHPWPRPRPRPRRSQPMTVSIHRLYYHIWGWVGWGWVLFLWVFWSCIDLCD